MPEFNVDESIEIDAPVEKVRDIIRDFTQWPTWSPWLSTEPDCDLTYADDGKSYRWDGEIIGSGEMKLLREEEQSLWYDLFFYKPWKSSSKVDFQFTPTTATSSVVRWRMSSSVPFFMFFMKAMMKAMIASDYRRGLSKLKDYAEMGSVPSTLEIRGLGEGVTTDYIGVRTTVDNDSIGEAMGEQLTQLKEFLDDADVEPSGPPFSIYHKFDMVKNASTYTAAIPIREVPTELRSGFVTGKLVSPRTFQVAHTGAYRHVGSAWSAAMMHERAKVFDRNKKLDPFEVYLSDPTTTAESENLTVIHLPAR